MNKYNDKIEERTHVIALAVDGKILNERAADILGVSVRQVQRMKSDFREHLGLSFHGNTGNAHAKTISTSLEGKILEIHEEPLNKNINFLYFQEILEEEHQIDISYTALRKLLLSNGIKSPRKYRTRKIRRSRPPKSHFGQMLQGDASKHPWYELLGDKGYYNLHGFIDDATKTPTGLYMTKNECATGYFEVMDQTFNEFGVPQSLYLDGLQLFFPSKPRKLVEIEIMEGMDPKKTNFESICDKFGIDLIHAKSSQAKGRVERMWGTLQGRLPRELAKRGITNLDSTNEFLKEYKYVLAKKYSIEPENGDSYFLPVKKNTNLDEILCMKYARTLDNGATFSLDGVRFVVEGMLPHIGKRIEILISQRIGIKVKDNSGKIYDVRPLTDTNRRTISDNSSIKAVVNNFTYSHCLESERHD